METKTREQLIDRFEEFQNKWLDRSLELIPKNKIKYL